MAHNRMLLILVLSCCLIDTSVFVGEEPAAKQAGGETPQKTFLVFRDAVLANDWKKAMAQFNPESRNMIIAYNYLSCYAGHAGEKGKSLAQKVIKNPSEIEKPLAAVAELAKQKIYLSKKNGKEIAEQIVAAIPDHAQFMSDWKNAFQEMNSNWWLFNLKDSHLQIISEQPDAVVGKVVDSQGMEISAMNAEKLEGRWFLDFNGVKVSQ